MFTGLIQALGRVQQVTPDGVGGSRLRVLAPELAASAVLGESIAINGCCLTVVESSPETLDFQCGPETLLRTNLGQLIADHAVNLERALKVGDSVGGHFVSGHIDCVGKITHIEPNGEWRTFTFEFPKEYDDLLIVKGSIAIDGISLTLVTVEPGKITVMLIPHTLSMTTLGTKAVGDAVNLEFDQLAKYVKKQLANLTIEV